MGWRRIIFVGITFFLIIILFLFLAFPFGKIDFGISKKPSYYLKEDSNEMQFYKNMRFPSKNISYFIENTCSLKKKNEMKRAFFIISNETNLVFYPETKGKILISCDEKTKTEGGLFIAGEGGPSKILLGENFNIILGGKILLIKDSNCGKPNIAIHELLHVLGFAHSKNDGNIMYPISKCPQIIGKKIPKKIKDIYSFPEEPDLKMENVSAFMKGRYLNLNVSISNQGLKKSDKAKLIVYINNDSVRKLDLEKIKVGFGLKINIQNIWISKLKIKELKIKIESGFNELSKKNNQIILNKID